MEESGYYSLIRFRSEPPIPFSGATPVQPGVDGVVDTIDKNANCVDTIDGIDVFLRNRQPNQIIPSQ